MNAMNVDQLFNFVKAAAEQNNDARLAISADWGQGRTIFGGITAAILLVAAQDKVSTSHHIQSISTNFIGPLQADSPFDIEVEVLRAGRSVTQVLAKIVQDQQVLVIQQTSFVLSRESGISITDNSSPDMPVPEEPNFLVDTPELAPAFVQHFDIHMNSGKNPFSASDESHVYGWMRFKDTIEQMNDAHITCLIDAWPPAVLQQFKQFGACSTSSWYIEFANPKPEVQAGQWLAYKCHTDQAGDGYAHTDAKIWNEAGQLIATSRQTVAIFDQ